MVKHLQRLVFRIHSFVYQLVHDLAIAHFINMYIYHLTYMDTITHINLWWTKQLNNLSGVALTVRLVRFWPDHFLNFNSVTSYKSL